MSCTQLFKAMADPLRLRILNLLADSPLCVCHFEMILRENQATISRQLQFLRAKCAVARQRRAQWMIYSLHPRNAELLRINLTYLRTHGTCAATLRADIARRNQAQARTNTPLCISAANL